jgi:hypothetical protein
VIVKSRVTILTGDPDMGAALRNEWKGPDLAEATARSAIVWLRPRDSPDLISRVTDAVLDEARESVALSAVALLTVVLPAAGLSVTALADASRSLVPPSALD